KQLRADITQKSATDPRGSGRLRLTAQNVNLRPNSIARGAPEANTPDPRPVRTTSRLKLLGVPFAKPAEAVGAVPTPFDNRPFSTVPKLAKLKRLKNETLGSMVSDSRILTGQLKMKSKS